MRNLLVIYGGHGAGKSTLAKNIILSDGNNFKELSTDFGKITVSENKRYVAVGKYSIKSGGADGISAKDYFPILNYILIHYPNSNIIIEGMVLSGILQTPLKIFLKLKYEYDCNIEQVLLYSSVPILYKRVSERNNRKPKLKIIQQKHKSVINTFTKMIKLKEFNSFVINTEEKDINEVFNEFISKSNFIRK